MLANIKFTLLKFKPGWYWSKISHKKYYSDDIGNIVWENEDMPVKTEIVSFNEMIDYIREHPGDSKAHRNAVIRILSERFPIKEMVGIDCWDGVIYVDLDLQHSLLISKIPAEKQMMLFKQLDYALSDIAPNNYFYIEHSSSSVGIHLMFYFNCDKTQHNYDRYCAWIHDIFRYRIDDYIKDFSRAVFDEVDGKEDCVFDSVYKRPYQKLYLTTKDMICHDVDGYCDDINVDFVQQETKKDEVNGTFDVKHITSKKQFDTHYYDRLYVLTALKKYVGEYDKVKKLWYSFCEQLTLYDNYTTQKFKNMLDQNWNKIKASEGHLSILKKYGFKINENKLHLHLKDNEFISDYVKDIIDFCEVGINLLVSGTGTGKTEVWKKIHELFSDILEAPYHKPILIIEPMNSIIDSKYDKDDFVVVTGSNNFSNIDLSSYKCVITNYNHLIRKTYDGYELIPDIDKFFSHFELIIVDESHILMKDAFRSEVLIPFMETLNKIKTAKVIIQTATPLFEKSVLDIKKEIEVHKKEKRNIKVIYRECTESTFSINQIICLTNYYISNKKKVYIYWKNGSLNNMKFLKSIFPESMIVYHKRDYGSADMEQINSEHILGDTNVIISSVYFGVGNDLNDCVDDAAVIIIGNNIWQEDVQAIGRWRNAKNVEACIITLPNEKDMINASMTSSFDYNNRFELVKKHYEFLLNDKYNRDKSELIRAKSYNIKNEDYVNYLTNMQVANEYSSQICIKNREFTKMGYDVRETFKPLLVNSEWLEELKTHRADIKDIRNAFFKDFLDGIYDWGKIRKDSTIEACAKIIRTLQHNELIKYCNMDKFTKSKIMNYGIFLRYYQKAYVSTYDYAEVFSILWAKQHINKKDKDTYSLAGVEVSNEDYYIGVSYLIWTYYRNKSDNKENMKSFYLKEFEKTVKAFLDIPDELINRIFVRQAFDDNYNKFIEEFLGSKLDNDEHVDKDELIDAICKIDIEDEHLNQTAKKIIDYYGDKKVRGKSGGKTSTPKKKCIVTKKFKHPEKYNLTVGQEFDSSSDLGLYTGKSLKTVTQWRNKEWIE